MISTVLGRLAAALQDLRRDGWVVGIACAAALAYAVVGFVESLAAFVVNLIDGQPVIELSSDNPFPAFFDDQPYTFVFFGHYVGYQRLLISGLLLLAVAAIVTPILNATRSPEDDAPQG